MRQLLVALSALMTTVVAAPVVRAQLRRLNILDVPNHRSSHAIATPRAGGVACLLGLVVGVSIGSASGLAVNWAVVGVAAALAGVGLLDDWRSLPPLPRLLAQVLAGLALGFSLGGVSL